MKNKTIVQIHNEIINKQISLLELINQSIKKDEQLKVYNPVITQNYENAKKQAQELQKLIEENKNNYLFGIPYSLKDNIITKDIRTTGGSKFLQNHIPVYDSFVKKLLDKNNAILLNKSNLDEFGLGGTGLYSFFGEVINPYNDKQVTGGSSSGSAVLVSKGSVSFAIGTDTGDSVRRPASILNIVGYKPSYGLISRNGVLPFSPALDHVAIFSNDVFDSGIVANALFEVDQNDFTSIKYNKDVLSNIKKQRKLKIAVFKPILDYVNPLILEQFNKLLEVLKNQGHIVDVIDFDFKLLQSIPLVYKIISSAQALSSYANFSNITFGNLGIDYDNYEDLTIKARTQYFGNQLKSRFAIGSFVTSQQNFESIFIKANQVKNKIVSSTNELWTKYDIVLNPAVHDFAETKEMVYQNQPTTNVVEDVMQIANFGGLPSITIPFLEEEQGFIGINLFAKKFDDDLLLNAAFILEKTIKGERNE